MRYLEAGLPRAEYHLCPPKGTDQHPPRFRTFEAATATESKQPGLNDRCAGLFTHFAPQGLLPGLIALGPATWKAPLDTIAADQHDFAAFGDTDAGSAMRSAGWRRRWRMP